MYSWTVSIIISFQVKRTSLWNKACDELRIHQDFLSRVKSNPDFLKDPYGNPFESEELKAQFNAATLGGVSEENDVDDDKSNFDDMESEEVNNSKLMLDKCTKNVFETLANRDSDQQLKNSFFSRVLANI
jgi:hypothetical protein